MNNTNFTLMDDFKAPKKYTKTQAKLKAESYCAYQERSQFEVKQKLFEWGLYANEVDEVISNLIADNFLNEERFANAYTIGKLRQKYWGKIKIKQGLKLKKVSEPLIKKALNKIDYDEYEAILNKLIDKKTPLIKEKQALKRQYKLRQYLLSKGFESDLIFNALKKS